MNIHDNETRKRTARLFRNGRSQAVRIPKELEFDGEEVLITATGDGKLMLEPLARKPSLLDVLATLEPLPEEDWMPEIEDFPPEPVDLKAERGR